MGKLVCLFLFLHIKAFTRLVSALKELRNFSANVDISGHSEGLLSVGRVMYGSTLFLCKTT